MNTKKKRVPVTAIFLYLLSLVGLALVIVAIVNIVKCANQDTGSTWSGSTSVIGGTTIYWDQNGNGSSKQPSANSLNSNFSIIGYIFMLIFCFMFTFGTFSSATLILVNDGKKALSHRNNDTSSTINIVVKHNLDTEYICPYCDSHVFLKNPSDLSCPHCGGKLDKKQ